MGNLAKQLIGETLPPAAHVRGTLVERLLGEAADEAYWDRVLNRSPEDIDSGVQDLAMSFGMRPSPPNRPPKMPTKGNLGKLASLAPKPVFSDEAAWAHPVERNPEWWKFRHDELVLYHFPDKPTRTELQKLWELGHQRKSEVLMQAARSMSGSHTRPVSQSKHVTKPRPPNKAREAALKMAREEVPKIVAGVMAKYGLREESSFDVSKHGYFLDWYPYPRNNLARIIYDHDMTKSYDPWHTDPLHMIKNEVNALIKQHPEMTYRKDVYGSIDISVEVRHKKLAKPMLTHQQKLDIAAPTRADFNLIMWVRKFVEDNGAKVVYINKEAQDHLTALMVTVTPTTFVDVNVRGALKEWTDALIAKIENFVGNLTDDRIESAEVTGANWIPTGNGVALELVYRLKAKGEWGRLAK